MKLIIGLTGTLASGKGTVAEILKENDFDHVILSNIIKEEAAGRNIVPTRENLQNLGNELREKHGAGVLAEIAIKKYEDSEKPLIIDGIRNSGEIDFLKKFSKETDSKFYLIAVDAPIETRYERMKKRKSSKDLISFEEFMKLDARDRGLNEKTTGQRVQDCLDRVDIMIINNFSYDELKKKVTQLLADLLKNKNL